MGRRRPSVLIISNSEDEHLPAVVGELRQYPVDVRTLFPGEFGAAQTLTISMSPTGPARVLTRRARRTLDLETIASVWYRRPRTVHLSEFGLDAAGLEFARSEWRAALDSAIAVASRALWVSHPDRLALAARKPVQIELARRLGFLVPDTIVTSDWRAARRFIDSHDGGVIVKPIGPGWVWRENMGDVAYILANRLDQAGRAALRDIEVAPVTIQEEVPKAYEVRVNVVGSAVLPIRIDSQSSEISSVDWRRYDHEHTPYSPEELPQVVADRCRALTKALHLEYSAIDLIRRPDGEFVFLETNGNGQFLWAEQWSGVPVSKALAELLAGQGEPLATWRSNSAELGRRTVNAQARVKRSPFLFRYQELERVERGRPIIASPERGGESNPKEEAPRPEPTRPTPWGD